jgi:hypothetical protein
VFAVDRHYAQFPQTGAEEIGGHNGAFDAKAARLRNFHPGQPVRIFHIEAEFLSPGLVKVLSSYLSCFLRVMVGED